MVRRTLNEMTDLCIFRLSQIIWAVFVFLLRKTGIIFFCTIISVYLMKLCKILGWKNTFELCFKNCNQISIRPTTGFIMWSHNQIFSQQDFFFLIFPDKLQKTSKSAVWVKLSRLISPCEIYGCLKQVITYDRPPFYLHFDTRVVLQLWLLLFKWVFQPQKYLDLRNSGKIK